MPSMHTTWTGIPVLNNLLANQVRGVLLVSQFLSLQGAGKEASHNDHLGGN
jgi:hypothetical protein